MILSDAAANSLLALLEEKRMRDNDPRPGLELPPIVADEDEIFAEECKGLRFHRRELDGVGAVGDERADELGAVTGQPELEAALKFRDPARFARLRADTEGTWKELVDRARARGVLKLG